MISKRGRLRGCRLCVILDNDLLNRKGVLKTARLAIRGGADMIQLRAKTAATTDMIETGRSLKALAENYGAILIINDRLDVAVAIDADGLHVGQGDINIGLARRMLGAKKLIGVSAKSVTQAIAAKASGADYLGVGPVFSTPIKVSVKARGLGLLEKVRKIDIPFFAIGGIDSGNLHKLTEKGFKKIAVIRAICRSYDPCGAARQLKEALV